MFEHVWNKLDILVALINGGLKGREEVEAVMVVLGSCGFAFCGVD